MSFSLEPCWRGVQDSGPTGCRCVQDLPKSLAVFPEATPFRRPEPPDPKNPRRPFGQRLQQHHDAKSILDSCPEKAYTRLSWTKSRGSSSLDFRLAWCALGVCRAQRLACALSCSAFHWQAPTGPLQNHDLGCNEHNQGLQVLNP